MSEAYAEIDGEVISLNQSRLQAYLTCKRKFYWLYERNLTVDRPQWPLDMGTAVHEGLANLNVGEPLPKALEETAKRYDEAMKKYTLLPQERDKYDQQRAQTIELIQAYVEHYGEQEDWAILAPEVKGRVEVGEGTDVFLVFRTDAIVSFRRGAFLLEHKTMAQNRLQNWQKYELDLQISAYAYGVAKILGINIQGVIVNGLVKTKVPQFNREMYTRTPAALAEFVHEFVEMAREIAWRRKRVAEGEPYERVFYRNTGACFNYNQECWFRSVCLHGEKMLALYKQRPMDYVDNPDLLDSPAERVPADSEGPGA